MKFHLPLLYTLLLGGCATSLPSLDERIQSSYLNIPLTPWLDSTLGIPSTPSKTDIFHIYLLNDAHETFVARAALVRTTDHTLDLQYYIWHDDISGKLLFNLIHHAVERGVHVRLLLGGSSTNDMDGLLLALDNHPNIGVRLFNPFIFRKWRVFGYIAGFLWLSHRIHNESFTADNRATVLGGRNVSDEYFKVNDGTIFADLDILATDHVVAEVSQGFDRYWVSHSAYSATSIIKRGDLQEGLVELSYADQDKNQTLIRYRQSIGHSSLYQKMQNNLIEWRSISTRLISDDPAKGLDRDRRKPPISERLQSALKQPEESVYLVPPYLIPTKSGVKAIEKLIHNGMGVTVLTNSLQATGVAAVHSGYVKYHRPLLKAEVKLYELQPDHTAPASKDRNLTGSSATSLHAKAFIVDKKRTFIGSFSLDPRSARLNAKMGIVIESPEVIGQMQRTLVTTIPSYAYQVTPGNYNKLYWYGPSEKRAYVRGLGAKFWKRMTSKILSVLPVGGLL